MLNIHHSFIPRLLGAAIASAALITPAIASAQDVPSYAGGAQDQQIQGTISAINGTWNITVADASGYNDSVELHQGTIINPTGLTLEPGMNVTIDGYADGSNFDALEIDTPYQYEGPPPVAVYYGAGDWYPGYAYGWGPSFSLFFDVGGHRFEQRPFFFGGAARHAIAPPSGWESRPHGFIGNAGNASGSQRRFVQTRNAAPVQQTRGFAAPVQQTRSFTPPQQQQTRSFAAPVQQTRSFTPPQQQQTRSFAAPVQQTRSFTPPQQQQTRSFAAPVQQTRSFTPPQQARSFTPPAERSAPAGRSAPPAQRGQDNGGRRH